MIKFEFNEHQIKSTTIYDDTSSEWWDSGGDSGDAVPSNNKAIYRHVSTLIVLGEN